MEGYIRSGYAAKRIAQNTTEFAPLPNFRKSLITRDSSPLILLERWRDFNLAYSLSRNWSNAESAYQDFLTRWSDADPNIPLLKQVKTEPAELGRFTIK